MFMFRFDDDCKQIRIEKKATRFSLSRSKHSFGSLLELIMHYTGPRTWQSDLRCQLVYLPEGVAEAGARRAKSRRLSMDTRESSTDAPPQAAGKVKAMKTIMADDAHASPAQEPAGLQDQQQYGNPHFKAATDTTGTAAPLAQPHAYELADIQAPTFKPPAPPADPATLAGTHDSGHQQAATRSIDGPDDTESDVDHLPVPDGEKWYFGQLTKAECNALLKPSPTGTFLVRESSSTSAYVVAVKDTSKVKHYTVTDTGSAYLFGGKEHDSLAKIIGNFRAGRVSTKNGTLHISLPPPGGAPFAADSAGEAQDGAEPPHVAPDAAATGGATADTPPHPAPCAASDDPALSTALVTAEPAAHMYENLPNSMPTQGQDLDNLVALQQSGRLDSPDAGARTNTDAHSYTDADAHPHPHPHPHGAAPTATAPAPRRASAAAGADPHTSEAVGAVGETESAGPETAASADGAQADGAAKAGGVAGGAGADRPLLDRSASTKSQASLFSVDSQAPSLAPKETNARDLDERARFSVLREGLDGDGASDLAAGSSKPRLVPGVRIDQDGGSDQAAVPTSQGERAAAERAASKAPTQPTAALEHQARASTSAPSKPAQERHARASAAAAQAKSKSSSPSSHTAPSTQGKAHKKSKRRPMQKLEFVAEQEFRWILPNRSETGRSYLTVLQGVRDASLKVVGSGTLELYDKTGTVRKKYDWKKTMPKFTLRLQSCLAISKGRSPRKGHPCLMLTFLDRGTLIMSSTKTDVLNAWLSLLNEHWCLDMEPSKKDGDDTGSATLASVTTSFQATKGSHLSVALGEHVTIIDDDLEELEEGMVLACNKYGKQGMVPLANLDLPPAPTPPPSLNASFKQSGGVAGDDGHGHGVDVVQLAMESDSDIWGTWKLERSQIELRNVLGEGSHGEVMQGVLRGKGEFAGLVANVAVKKLKKQDAATDFLKEAEVMMALRHVNLVNLCVAPFTAPLPTPPPTHTHT